MKKIIKNNGLSISLLFIFTICLILMSITGWQIITRITTLKPTVTYFTYLTSGNFIEALMENMESEFLQIFAYILFTAFLYQKGLAESKKNR